MVGQAGFNPWQWSLYHHADWLWGRPNRTQRVLGALSLRQSSQSVILTNHLHLVEKLRIPAAIHSLSHTLKHGAYFSTRITSAVSSLIILLLFSFILLRCIHFKCVIWQPSLSLSPQLLLHFFPHSSFCVTSFLTSGSHIYLSLPLGHFPFSLMLKTFFEVSLHPFLKRVNNYLILSFVNLPFKLFIYKILFVLFFTPKDLVWFFLLNFSRSLICAAISLPVFALVHVQVSTLYINKSM